MSNSTLTNDARSFGHAAAIQAAAENSSMFGWPTRALQWVTETRSLNRSIACLQELDDRLLKDIGLDRSEISSAVRHGRQF